MAEQSDEDRFHKRNKDRPFAEKDASPKRPDCIEQGINRTEQQDRVQDPLIPPLADQIHQNISDADTKPADPHRDGLGR